MADETIVDPVGKVKYLDAIEHYLKSIAKEWTENKDNVPWWKFWERAGNMFKVTGFLLNALDDLISYIDDLFDSGEDKKATVLSAMTRLFDFVAAEALPIWLWPFSGLIKNYIINIVISTAIDWIVDKYRNGEWHKKEENKVSVLWANK